MKATSPTSIPAFAKVLIVVALLAELVAVAWLYWPGLHGPLVMDDYPQLSGLFNLDAALPADWKGDLFSNSGPLGRPVAMATFMFNGITAGPDIFAWKYTNLMIHLASGAFVIWLTALVLSAAGAGGADEKPPAWAPALLIGGLWLAHPIQVSTILYTVQRMTELSALFCFAGMVAYLCGRRRQLSGRTGGHTLVLMTYLVFLPLAAWSKENGALLPAYIFLLEVYFLKFSGDSRARGLVVVSQAGFFLLPAAATILYVATHFHQLTVDAFATMQFSSWQRVLTEQRVLMMYIGEILLPTLGRFGFFHDDILISTGWLHPVTTLLSGLCLLSLAVAAVLLRKKRPVFAFGIAFFIVGQLLESTMLPLELAFEHRNYLPSYGLLLAAADMVRALDIRGFAKAAIGIVVVVLFALVLRLYVERWASYPKLMEYAAQTHPTSPQVMATIAGSLTAQGRYRDAIDLLATRPTLGGRFQTLYILCLRDHRLSRGSLQDVESSMLHPLDPYAVTGLVELAREGLDDNCSFDRDEFLQLADTALQRGIRDTAGRFKVHLYKAHYLWAMRRRDAAIREALAAQEVIPTDPVALFLATEWRISLGRMVEAKNSYDQAVRIAKASDKDYGTYIKDVGKMFAEPGLAAHWLKGD